MAEFISMFMVGSCVIGVIAVMVAIRVSKNSLKTIADPEEDVG